MTKKISVGSVILLVLLAVLITFQATYLIVESKYKDRIDTLEAGGLTYSKLAELDRTFRHYYVGEIDEEKLLDSLMQAYIDGTGDLYGQYLSADAWQALQAQSKGEGVGVGILVTYDQNEECLTVLRVYDGGPAYAAGMQSGDRILTVNGTQMSDLGYTGALDEVKGAEGTEVNFTVQRGEETFSMTMTRAAYEIQTVDYRMYESDGSKVGIIRIDEFQTATVSQFTHAVDTLLADGAQSLVFDMRSNPGGELNSVVDILDYLLPEGPVVHIRDKNNETVTYSSDDSHEVDCSMAVLTNGTTASAAELFSCALRDYNKAILVGTKTYGKGCIQNLMTMSDGSMVRVTFGYYDPPYSENYDGVGLEPDITVEPDEMTAAGGYYTLTTEQDNQMMTAIAALQK